MLPVPAEIKYMRDSLIFDEAIAKYFAPFARDIGLPISKMSDGIYEITSPYFILRVRLHTGHRRGLNVLMRLSKYREFSDDDRTPGVMYGIGCFMENSCKDWQNKFVDVETDDDFRKQTELLAEAAKQFLAPYLLGEKKDFQVIKETWDRKGKAAAAEIRKLKFPSFAQKRWHFPKSP